MNKAKKGRISNQKSWCVENAPQLVWGLVCRTARNTALTTLNSSASSVAQSLNGFVGATLISVKVVIKSK